MTMPASGTQLGEARSKLSFVYSCVCGEWVIVWRMENDRTTIMREPITVTCSAGHSATITPENIWFLETQLED